MPSSTPARPAAAEPVRRHRGTRSQACRLPGVGPHARVAAMTLDAPPSPLRTLFVEDNLDLREHIAMLLEEEGLSVVSCGSAEEALSLYASERFDLVLTDVSLPKMSGVDLARAILRASPQAWVVFSSGYSLGADLSAFGPHVRALGKPFEIDDLQAVAQEARAQMRKA